MSGLVEDTLGDEIGDNGSLKQRLSCGLDQVDPVTAIDLRSRNCRKIDWGFA